MVSRREGARAGKVEAEGAWVRRLAGQEESGGRVVDDGLARRLEDDALVLEEVLVQVVAIEAALEFVKGAAQLSGVAAVGERPAIHVGGDEEGVGDDGVGSG